MLAGGEHLQRARLLLAEQDGSPRTTLKAAATAFWASVIDEDQWPEPLRLQGQHLQQMLLARGPIVTTIDLMTEEELERARCGLESFLDAAFLADGQSP